MIYCRNILSKRLIFFCPVGGGRWVKLIEEKEPVMSIPRGKKFRLSALIVCMSAVLSAPLFSQGLANFSVHLRPGIEVPIGSKSSLFTDNAMYKIGGSGSLRLQYIFPEFPIIYSEGMVNYGLQRTQADPLSLLSFGVGGGINLRIGNIMSFFAGPELGWYVGFFQDASGESTETSKGSNPYFGGSTHVMWDFTPNFTLSVGGGYKYYLGYDQESDSFTDLYQGAFATVGTVFHMAGNSGRSKLKVENVQFDPVFPVFYGYYDDNPVGSVTVRNEENSSITDVEVYFNVNQYMEQPKLSAIIPSLKRGESQEVDLKALFTNNMLQLTESTKVSAEIIAEYTYLGKRFTHTVPQTLRILDRNSMTWDDDRKAASFVTAKDPTVLIFSKNTAGLIREQGNNPINLNLRIAMGIFETLRLYGMNYVIDPQSAYQDKSQDASVIDYLQFPAQSLTFRAGDCDDLSILYSSLLESVGIETTFITMPGHIFMAFSLDMEPKEAEKEFTNTDNLIFLEDKTWVPVEMTLITEGYLKAWRIGAKQWREASAKNVTGFFPIHEAWNTYGPVAMPGGALSLVYPSTESIIASYKENLEVFINREIQPKVDYYNEQLSERGDSAKIRNRFGILYARYGLYSQAEEQFVAAVSKDSRFTAPMVNMGNVYFLREDMDQALSWYEKAKQLEPDNPKVLAGLARTQYELEKYDDAENNYRNLKIQNADMAARYAYIVNESATVGRAAAAQDKGKTLWEDEEE